MRKFKAFFTSEGVDHLISINCVGERYSRALEQAERILEIEYGDYVDISRAILISLLVTDSDYKPLCPKCGRPLIPSKVGNYILQCLDCDEDFYLCETKE